MAEYQISEENKNKLKNQHLKKVISLITIPLIAGILISFIQIGDLKIFLIIIIPMIIFIFGATAIGIIFGLKMFKKSYLDIILKIDDKIMSIIKGGKEIIRLEKNEIIKIEETYDSTLIIYNKKYPKKIFIKNQFQNFNELYNDLNNLKQIEKTNRKMNKKIIYVFSFLFLIIYGIFLISSTKEIVIISGIIIAILMVISLVVLLLNKFVDKKIKVISLMLLYIIYEVIKKIIKII
jgi:hypothetical protein